MARRRYVTVGLFRSAEFQRGTRIFAARGHGRVFDISKVVPVDDRLRFVRPGDRLKISLFVEPVQFRHKRGRDRFRNARILKVPVIMRFEHVEDIP